jgi:hypothetical protein
MDECFASESVVVFVHRISRQKLEQQTIPVKSTPKVITD